MRQKRNDGWPASQVSLRLALLSWGAYLAAVHCDPRTAKEGTRCKHFARVGGRERREVVKPKPERGRNHSGPREG